MRQSFTLYKEKTKSGTLWYARYWDEAARKYKYSRSTGVKVEGKKERRREAEDAARILLETIPAINKNSADSNEANTFESIIKSNAVSEMSVIKYLSDFWTTDSEYAQFRRNVLKKPLSVSYINMNHNDIRLHVEPFDGFFGITLGSLNKAILKKWMIWLSGRKIMRKKKNGVPAEGDTISGRRANIVIQAVRVAVRWAVDNEEIPSDPFRKLGKIAETNKEKGILSIEERNALIAAPVKNYRTRLMMLLGCLCSMRRGEIRGLKWGDIEGGIITIRNNYIDNEGIKLPKYNSVRKVPVPAAVQNLLDIARARVRNASAESFVLENLHNPGMPVSNNFFRYGMTKELCEINISKAQQKQRRLTPHSTRHTFVTLAQLAGISDVEIRALSGHKSAAVFEKYSHVPQVINFDEARKKLDVSIDAKSDT